MSTARILVADPDPDVRETLKIYLETSGHEVKTVALAGDVIKTARPWLPNAILISADFTDQDANRVCRDLIDDTLTGHIPLIMLLEVNERQARLEALEAGVNDIVAKPFDIEELTLRVEAAIRLSTMFVDA